MQKKHQGKKYKFTIDLKDFFPSINNKKVYKMFVNVGLFEVTEVTENYPFYLIKCVKK